MTINYSILQTVIAELSKYSNAELMIVSKNQSILDIKELMSSGYQQFGENRVQEAEKKFSNLRDEFTFKLNLIGPLQSNKVKNALALFDCIQSLDRFKIVDEIIKHHNSDSRCKSFYIQINIGSEKQKSGVGPQNFESLYAYCLKHNLRVEGIMCIPPNDGLSEKYFQEMVALKNNINHNLKLSMGMSADYLTALQNGSNTVRIGSLIFQ